MGNLVEVDVFTVMDATPHAVERLIKGKGIDHNDALSFYSLTMDNWLAGFETTKHSGFMQYLKRNIWGFECGSFFWLPGDILQELLEKDPKEGLIFYNKKILEIEMEKYEQADLIVILAREY